MNLSRIRSHIEILSSAENELVEAIAKNSGHSELAGA